MAQNQGHNSPYGSYVTEKPTAAEGPPSATAEAPVDPWARPNREYIEVDGRLIERPQVDDAPAAEAAVASDNPWELPDIEYIKVEGGYVERRKDRGREDGSVPW